MAGSSCRREERRRRGITGPDFLVARSVPAQCLVGAEHLFACPALVLVPPSRAELHLFFYFLFLLFTLTLGFSKWGRAICHPNVSRKHHERKSHIFLWSGVGDGADGFGLRLGFGFGFGPGSEWPPPSLGPTPKWVLGRLGLALSVLDYRARVDREGELWIDEAKALLRVLSQAVVESLSFSFVSFFFFYERRRSRRMR